MDFNFDKYCEKSFQEIKKQMQSDIILAHYDPKLPLVLAVDASPTGVGAVLSHIDKGVERPIHFASQTLSEPNKHIGSDFSNLVSISDPIWFRDRRTERE